MQSIENLWLKYRGQSTTIFANGPSLHKFTQKLDYKNLSDEFYKGIWIGLDSSFEHFPDKYHGLTYILASTFDNYENLKVKIPNDKLIIPESPGLYDSKKDIYVTVENEEAYGYPIQDPHKNKKNHLPLKDYSIDRDVKFFTYSDLIQTAMHLCCYMGFNKIYLVGVEYKFMLKVKDDDDVSALKQEGTSYLSSMLETQHNLRIVNIGRFL